MPVWQRVIIWWVGLYSVNKSYRRTVRQCPLKESMHCVKPDYIETFDRRPRYITAGHCPQMHFHHQPQQLLQWKTHTQRDCALAAGAVAPKHYRGKRKFIAIMYAGVIWPLRPLYGRLCGAQTPVLWLSQIQICPIGLSDLCFLCVKNDFHKYNYICLTWWRYSVLRSCFSVMRIVTVTSIIQ